MDMIERPEKLLTGYPRGTPLFLAAVFFACLCVAKASPPEVTIRWPNGPVWNHVQVIDLRGDSVTLRHDWGVEEQTTLTHLPPDAQQRVKQAWEEMQKQQLAEANAAATGADITIPWPDGRIWKHVQVSNMDSVCAVLSHDQGIEDRVAFEDLPPDARIQVKSAWIAARKRSAAAAEAARPSSAPPPDAGTDIALKDGEVFHHARVFSIDEATASIMHQTGVTRVNLADLPDDLRAKVAPDYTPERASAFLAGEAQAQRTAAEAQARADAQAASQAAVDEKVLSSWFEGKITRCVDEGALAKGIVWLTSEAMGTRMLGDNAGGAVENVKSYEKLENATIRIEGLPDGSLVDGSSWKGTVYAIGSYQYTTSRRAKRSVPRFTVSRAAAREYAAKGEE